MMGKHIRRHSWAHLLLHIPVLCHILFDQGVFAGGGLAIDTVVHFLFRTKGGGQLGSPSSLGLVVLARLGSG